VENLDLLEHIIPNPLAFDMTGTNPLPKITSTKNQVLHTPQTTPSTVEASEEIDEWVLNY
jgi:hypothetical protein